MAKVLTQVIYAIQNSRKKYVLGIFLDIGGAFDNAWWDKIIVQLANFGIKGKEIQVIKDYFRNRKPILRFRGVQAEKELTMGCPQGSVLGPTLWNILFDTFLRLMLPEVCSPFAYADDGLNLVASDSRVDLEDKARVICEMIQEWSQDVRLTLSVGKTKIMLLKGKLPGRSPIVRMSGEKLEYVSQIKYLGVIVDEKLIF